ncbi:MAG: DNA mismatch repair protein, partial [Halobacteriaceae archaeon]
MRLEEYWGVGPKTRRRLEESIGAEAAVEAIESANGRKLVEAGLSRGRATRILRRANSGAGMDLLATGDTRDVYRSLVERVGEYAVTDHARDRIRVLTPLLSEERIEERLDRVLDARDSWAGLDEATRESVLGAFEEYDSTGGERSAVEAALALRDAGVTEGVFEPLGDLDAEALREGASALAALDDGSVREGADEELDARRSQLRAVEDLEGSALDLLEELREGGVRESGEFREAFREHLRAETDLDGDRLREAMPEGATDAADFVGTTLRELRTDLRAAVEEREEAVAADLRETVEATREEVDAAVAAVDDVAFYVSLARFAVDRDLVRPEFCEDGLAVVGARNLDIDPGAVQPVDYAVGDHGLDGDLPDERVAVLTGANSGGKTTLLETLCQVALLAQMGLPVPAERARVSVVDAVVFHRRHASFNAGV